MESTDNATLEDRPKAFDRRSMDRADHILSLSMIDGCMRNLFAKMLVANPPVGAEQANLFPTIADALKFFETFVNSYVQCRNFLCAPLRNPH